MMLAMMMARKQRGRTARAWNLKEVFAKLGLDGVEVFEIDYFEAWTGGQSYFIWRHDSLLIGVAIQLRARSPRFPTERCEASQCEEAAVSAPFLCIGRSGLGKLRGSSSGEEPFLWDGTRSRSEERMGFITLPLESRARDGRNRHV